MIELLVVLSAVGVLGTGTMVAMVVGPGERWRTDATLLLLLWLMCLGVALVVLSLALTAEETLSEEPMEIRVKEGEGQ